MTPSDQRTLLASITCRQRTGVYVENDGTEEIKGFHSIRFPKNRRKKNKKISNTRNSEIRNTKTMPKVNDTEPVRKTTNRIPNCANLIYSFLFVFIWEFQPSSLSHSMRNFILILPEDVFFFSLQTFSIFGFLSLLLCLHW